MFLESERKKVKSLSRVQLCDPVDCSLPGSSVHGILQAGILECVAISFSRGSAQPRDRTRVSCVGGGCFNLWATKDMFLESQMLFWLRKPKLALSMYYYIKIEFPFLLMKLQSPEKVLTQSGVCGTWTITGHVLCLLRRADSWRPYESQPVKLLCPWDPPGKNTVVDSMPPAKALSPPRDRTRLSYVCSIGRWLLFISCICRQIFNH